MNKILYILLFFTALLQAQERFTPSDAVKLALEKNHGVVIARNQKEISKAQNNPGNAGMSPTVSLNGGYSFSSVNSHQEFSSGSTQDRTGAISNNLNASANVNWIVFDGMRMFAVKKRLELNEGLTDINSRIQMENTVYIVLLAYYDMVRIKQLIKAQQKNLDVIAERKKIANVRLDAGSDSKVDLLTTINDENKSKSDIMRLELQLQNAKGTLNALMSRSADTDLNVIDSIEVNYDPQPEELKRSAEKNSLLLQSRQNEAIIGQTIKEGQSANLPFVSLNGAYNFTSFRSEAGFLFLNKQNGMAAGVTATWLLFNGGRNNKLIKERQIQMMNQKIYSDQVKVNIDAVVYINHQAFLTSKKIFELEKDNLANARELLFVSMERYRVGKSSLLETKESQRTLEEAQTRCINALYELKKAETELLKANGGLVK